MKYPWHLTLTLLLLVFTNSYSSDLEKEKRWSEQIVDSLLVGEAQWLEDTKGKFLAIMSPSNLSKTKGTVILLHGIGVHPNWPDIIYPLRSRLPDAGWATLSIQMPILANTAAKDDYIALFNESQQRIQAAISFLTQQKASPLILLGHSLGATMGAQFLANTPDNNIQAFIAIGLSQATNDPVFNNVEHLQKIEQPILDLYGSQDLSTILLSAKQRKSAAKKSGNSLYRQLKVEGADHMFNGLEDELLQIIQGWLHKNAGKY